MPRKGLGAGGALLCTIDYAICINRCDRKPNCLPPPANFRQLRTFDATYQEPSTGDPIADQIGALARQIVELMYPFVIAGETIPTNIQNQIDDLATQMDNVAGGDAVQYMRNLLLRRELETANLEESFGNAPPYPVLYAAQIQRSNGEAFILRGQTEADGQYTLFVPRDGNILQVSFYDPQTNSFGTVTPRIRPNAPYRLPRFYLLPLNDTFTDFDNDGLADVVELVYGTDPGNPDTDGDGVPDGAEVDQGTDPLGGFVAQTGIIATADTPGTAVDICAVNDIAIVADSEAGVSVFNVFNGMNPTIIAQVDTPGVAQAVACAGDRIAVADGDAGLAIIDISDPPAAQIIYQLNLSGSAQAVAVAGDIAYVGTSSGQLVSVDMASGTVLEQIGIGTSISDIAIGGDALYVLTTGTLHTLPSFVEGDLQVVSAVASPGSIGAGSRSLRLFVGGGIAYATHTSGYNTFDLADPFQPILIAQGSTGQFGWKQIIPNGSGLGVAAVSPNSGDGGPRHISLYDVRNPAQTNVFLTQFETPGLATAVSIYNGLAYVADSKAGMQVINYLAYDAQGVPPTIELTTNFSPGSAEEGQLLSAIANVTDDVQVRNVEFFVDGEKVATDGNFPFEHRFVTPLIAEQPTFTLQARARDTGGNTASTEVMTITLIPDATPPRLKQVAPLGGGRAVDTLLAFWNEPIDLGTLTADTFQLFEAGPDGEVDTGDDVPVTGGVVSFRDEVNAATRTFDQPLPDGLYRAVLTTGITDLAGNPFETEFAWRFHVGDAAFWAKDADGSWDDPANWSIGNVPGADEDVIIDVLGDLTITHSQGDTSINSLLSENRVVLSGGTLTVADIGTFNRTGGTVNLTGTLDNTGTTLTLDATTGDWQLNGGTILGGEVIATAEAQLLIASNGNNRLAGVMVNGDIEMSVNGAKLLVEGGLTLNGTITLSGTSAVLGFLDTQTFDSGTVVLSGLSAWLGLEGSGTLTLGPNVTVRGGNNGGIASSFFIGGSTSTLINRGRITADITNRTLSIFHSRPNNTFINEGTIEATNNATLTINGSNFTNNGTIQESNGGQVIVN
ncbi:Ig-like domain-containing protein [Candidatus Poribacteria bacterium]|nr:Ig-like domain-containing protein [Candidatus Poribacteria bacterium]